MPQFIDKSNALAWLDTQTDAPLCVVKFCEAFAEHGEKKAEIAIDHMNHALNSEDFTWVVVNRTGDRQQTRSFGVYVMRNNELIKCAPLLGAILGEDKNGNVKVNYSYVLDQFLNMINPFAQIRHI